MNFELMMMDRNTQIKSVDSLKKWVGNNQNLESFDLDLLETQVDEKIRKLMYSKQGFLES